jgi:putative peptidoglycan lipid II flippase
MLKKFRERIENSLMWTTVLLAIFSIISRVLGLLRDRLFTGTFGTGGVLDSYYSAFRIPDLVYNILVLGTLSSAFIPLFSRLIHKKDKLGEAQKLADDILLLVALIMGALSVVIFAFAPWLVRVVALSYDGQKFADTVMLTRIMAFSPLIFSLSSVVTAVLHSYKKFLVASIAPLFYNFGIIAGIVYLYPKWGVAGLGYGVVLGALLHFLVQLPALYGLGYPLQVQLDFNIPSIKKMWNLYWPRILVIDVSMVSLFIGTVVASKEDSAVSVFNLAYNLNALPMGVLAISFATAIFPRLTEKYAKEDYKGFDMLLAHGVAKIIYAILPVSFLMIVSRAQLVRLIYGTGRFDWQDTNFTLVAMSIMVLSLIFQSLIPLFARSFYAKQDMKTPMKIGLMGMVLNVVLSISLYEIFGFFALAWAFSITMAVVGLTYAKLVFGNISREVQDYLWRFFVRVFTIASFSAGISQVVKHFVGLSLEVVETDYTTLKVLVHLSVPAIIGLGSYWILSKWWGLNRSL